MKVQVRLIILSDYNDKVYVNTDVNLFPFMELNDEQPINVAVSILERVCGVKCLPFEFVISNHIYTEDGILYITYGIFIPYNINNQDNKYKMVELNEFCGRIQNEMDKKIVSEMQYML